MKIFFLPSKNKIYKLFTLIITALCINLNLLINNLNSEVFLENKKIEYFVSYQQNLNLQYFVFSTEPLFINFPNPFKSLTYIYIRLPQVSNCSVKIYDLFGNIVKTYELTGRQEYIITWDGKNELQQSVSTGGYICVLLYENIRLIRKIGFVR